MFQAIAADVLLGHISAGQGNTAVAAYSKDLKQIEMAHKYGGKAPPKLIGLSK